MDSFFLPFAIAKRRYESQNEIYKEIQTLTLSSRSLLHHYQVCLSLFSSPSLSFSPEVLFSFPFQCWYSEQLFCLFFPLVLFQGSSLHESSFPLLFLSSQRLPTPRVIDSLPPSSLLLFSSPSHFSLLKKMTGSFGTHQKNAEAPKDPKTPHSKLTRKCRRQFPEFYSRPLLQTFSSRQEFISLAKRLSSY